MGNLTIELSYALDTFYFLMCTVLVMWMAAGFAMLEAGLVRAKNTVEILNKNALLYGIACIVYLLVGYNIMYPADPISSVIPGLDFLLGADNSTESVVAGGDAPYYSRMADFIFQAVFAAATMPKNQSCYCQQAVECVAQIRVEAAQRLPTRSTVP